MPRKFIMLSDSILEKKAKTGTTAYGLAFHDYGLARDDTNNTGVEHMSITLDPDGNYPGFTHPRHMLQEVKE